MQRKRAKLQIQNSEMVSEAHTRIFNGLAVYVNGQTDPPQHELRRILVENGGIFQPYLVNKASVTHIVTDNLTEAKMREFKNMKVVRPEWLTESIKSGILLPWKDFAWTKNAGPSGTQSAAPAIQIPRYAADASNLNAQRVMADPANYYEHSRLHFLEARIQADALEKVNADPISPRKGKGRDEERVIMHCDFDCFFVSAGLLTRPALRGKPVVAASRSTSEVACASYEARKCGIKNGMRCILCSSCFAAVAVSTLTYNSYKKVALQFYTVLLSRADEVEAVSIDEALIDVTQQVRALVSSPDPAKEFAERLRTEVRQATQCEISIGISHNVLLARLATRRAKPAGSLHLFPQDIPELTRDKALEKLGSTALKDLAKKSRAALSDALGPKTGEKLYNAIRGIDDTTLVSDKQPQSVSAELNVESRLNGIKMLGRTLTLKIMKRHPDAPVEGPKFMGHGNCEDFSKQSPLAGAGGRATSDGKVIGDLAYRMLKSFHFDPQDLRGIGIQVQKLEPASGPVNRAPNQQLLPFPRGETANTSRVGVVVNAPPTKPVQQAVASSSKLPPPAAAASTEILALPPYEAYSGRIRERVATLRVPIPGKANALAPQARPVNAPSRAPPRPLFPPRPAVLPRRNGAQKRGPTNNRFIDKKVLDKRRPPNARERPTHANLREITVDPAAYEEMKRNNPKKYEPRPDLYRHPLPRAKYPELPKLAQRLPEDEQLKKVFFKETDDLQNVVESWVNSFKNFPPETQDIEFVARFLTKAMDSKQFSDTSVERTIAVVKWWLVLIRRYWGDYEFFSSGKDEEEDGLVAEAWWRAFRDVKERLDVIARKKWGGCLAIR
ncbi:hypothetical protein C8F01DRAFT_1120105 [Mycena amicta]|nr:hypothetical protein C8F01DRAFT_1120105 [Mycena amicta]